jgi:hypothetical protein
MHPHGTLKPPAGVVSGRAGRDWACVRLHLFICPGTARILRRKRHTVRCVVCMYACCTLKLRLPGA